LAAEESDERGSPFGEFRFITCEMYLHVEEGRILMPLSIARDWLSRKRVRMWCSGVSLADVGFDVFHSGDRSSDRLSDVNYGVLRNGKR